MNAELYYLNSIAKELATTDVEGQDAILALHPRWEELCNIHGAPDLTLSKAEVTAPTLGARVTEFTFYVATSPSKNTQAGTQWVSNGEKDGEGTPSLAEKRKLIPLSVDTYRLKGIVTRMFKLPPLGCKLVWETGVMDPMPGREAEEGWSVSEDEDDGFGIGVGNEREHEQMMKEKGKWVEREVELVDGTREVGNFVEGKKARVRVEVRVAQT